MENRLNPKIGELIKHKRISMHLTLEKLASDTGVSNSHIGRIERGERFPSARVLRKMAEPLGFKEEELFMLAGFLSTHPERNNANLENKNPFLSIDPFVANCLAQEPVEIQRSVIGILSLLKTISKVNK